MPKSTGPLTPAQVYRFAFAFCQPRLALRSVGKAASEVLMTVLFAATAPHLLHLPDLPAASGTHPAGDLCQRPVRRPLLPRGAQAQRSTPPRRPPAQAVPAPARAAAPPRRRPSPLALFQPALPAEPRGAPAPRRGTGPTRLRLRHRLFVLQVQRFTLAVTPVVDVDSLEEVLQELLLLVGRAGLKPGLLLLDHSFSRTSLSMHPSCSSAAADPHAGLCPRREADRGEATRSNIFKHREESSDSATPSRTARRTRPRSGSIHEAGAVGGPAWPEEERHMGLRVLGDRPGGSTG